VLVYEEPIDTAAEDKKSASKRKDLERNEKWRQKFLRNLQAEGVQYEEVVTTDFYLWCNTGLYLKVSDSTGSTTLNLSV